MDVDEGRVTYSKSGRGTALTRAAAGEKVDPHTVQNAFKDFVSLYRNTDGSYVYLEQLRENVHLMRYFLEVKMEDLQEFRNSELTELIKKHPGRWLPVFESAIKEVAKTHNMFGYLGPQSVQVQLYWDTHRPTLIRYVQKLEMGQLCAVQGIAVKCSSTKQKVVTATLQCSSCKNEIKQEVPPNSSAPIMPPTCQANMNAAAGEKCRPNPYIIRPDRCQYVNIQFIKIQESPESVPTGELPRHIELQIDRELVAKVSPGQRLLVVGINNIFREAVQEKGRKAVGIRRRYLKGVGLMIYSASGRCASVNGSFSALRPSGTLLWDTKQEKEFKELSKSPTLYQDLADSLAPSIYGHPNIKKACVCQLFGGTRKRLPDGGKLRGDMNILLIGDPSTAKSQLLKAVYNIAPIGVYTSGKGSSAAGLTAAVGRESNRSGTNKGGGYYLEGGSMVLADGGVVCIDEFDKMREQDTVAIHEAMEQQTISIAKAGLSTVLNSRTSVLAAANPSMGCYDPLKSNEEQMDFKATILSRFDLIFKVLDPPNREKDELLARHILSLHRNGSSSRSSAVGPISHALLKSYVAYCRAQIITKLDAGAEEELKNYYVQARKAANEVQKGDDRSVIKITVRQLESLVRITESLAKMRCQKLATAENARESIRLYTVATVDAINSGVVENALSNFQEEAVLEIEDKIESRIPLGTQVRTSRLVSNLEALGEDKDVIERALFVMCRRGALAYKSHKKYLVRLRSGG